MIEGIKDETVRLIPGKTSLGTIRGRGTNGEVSQFEIYYGNIGYRMDGKKIRISEDRYLQLLDAFLNSDEGKKYERPSLEEIKRVTERVWPKPEKTEEPAKKFKSEKKADKPEAEDEPLQKAYPEETEEEAAERKLLEQLQAEKEAAEKKANEERAAAEEKLKQDQARLEEALRLSKLKAEETKKAAEEKEKAESKWMEAEMLKTLAAAEPDLEDDEKDDESEDLLTRSIPEDRERPAGKKNVLGIIASILAVLFALAAGYFGAITFGFLNNPFSTKAAATPAEVVDNVHIVQINQDAVAGQEITESMLTDAVISSSEYNLLSEHKYIDTDGSVGTDYLILWENKDTLAGKYLAEDVKAGHNLTTSEVADIRLNGSIVEMSINGEVVRVPLENVTIGSSNVQLYAIISTGNQDGTVRTVAVNLGALKLEGRNVTDVIDSAGYSVMNSITGAQATPEAPEDEAIVEESSDDSDGQETVEDAEESPETEEGNAEETPAENNG